MAIFCFCLEIKPTLNYNENSIFIVVRRRREMLLPIELKPKSNVLIAGAGGGFDFLCGLPIGISLQEKKHSVIYANYSFTNLKNVTGERISENMVKVTHSSSITDETYFPEGYFAQWMRMHKRADVPVYCFEKAGVLPIADAYKTIAKLHKIDAVFLIDGGVDGIFRGDEYGLGTPSMDSISMAAANLSGIASKYYVFTAFGSEGVGHELSHADVLQRVSDLIKAGGYYGISSLVKSDAAAKDFITACGYIFGRMPKHQQSNIVNSILRSIKGSFGYTAFNEKTSANPIWISALTSMYWFFDLDKTVKMKLFYDDIINTTTVAEVSDAIEKTRKNNAGQYTNIPI